jgi:hypothetical protein
MFNLGPQELIILGLCFGLPVIAGLVALVIVLTVSGQGRKDE